ncbi:ubiquitin-conjugating enzyme E2 G1 [Histomonas meleagridis]|uniref:ubiquitin-conjugating enzyme E2 G1 n=1 Tax=Histomonas meleagridis TaxID=135588 RepID=UPI00355A6D2B|nr:ubiquitin-conjugating enzyme E2 G1 [Histomonas meleagridis]KAH0797476.1 ubiquitin-conjugating enzyme E2 G1 [Histomonas meleagridis]KAH0797482.1 ubiquitin-conjugating enzyme E2 G1 [Histomonas meleagridis]
MANRNAAARILSKMYHDIKENPCQYFSAGLINDDLFKWRVTIIGPSSSPYEGSILPAELEFPDDFPLKPPKMRFLCPMWHPNIDAKTGKVCISILHDPGDDPNEYEKSSERWLPIHTVDSIVISVISMLTDPNPESPLNVEANRDFMFNKQQYIRKVRRMASEAINYC